MPTSGMQLMLTSVVSSHYPQGQRSSSKPLKIIVAVISRACCRAQGTDFLPKHVLQTIESSWHVQVLLKGCSSTGHSVHS